jgi:hypothetical protein
LDPQYAVPYFADAVFPQNAALYAKWITVYTNAFTYTVASGRATITGFSNATATIVVIPSYINSFPVYEIRGFANKTMIREAIIGDGIQVIGASAFSGCNSMTKVTIPDSVTSIEQSAFSGCSGLTSITIPAGVTSIGNRAFYECIGLTSITRRERIQDDFRQDKII